MPKNLLLIISLSVVVLTAFLVYTFSDRDQYSDYKPGRKSEIDTVINQGKFLFKEAKEKGTDLSNGPCLTNALVPGWVLDVVHNPRQPVDDLTENQCAAIVEGKADHFVELDTNGNLVRTR